MLSSMFAGSFTGAVHNFCRSALLSPAISFSVKSGATLTFCNKTGSMVKLAVASTPAGRRCRFLFKLSLLDFHSVTGSSAGSFTHGRSAASTSSQRASGGACPSRVFGPFNWHNLAFDPFKLSPPAGQRAMRESLCGVVV